MRDRGTERGAITIKTLLSFAFLLFVSYLGYKFIPIYVNAYDFDNALKTQAQYSGSFKTNEVIMKELLTKASELQLPITRKDIKIERNKSRITINVEYTVPVKTPFFTYDWHFSEEEAAVLF